MPTTTIRLEDDLKARVAAAAEREGKTAHAFILDAIAQTVEQTELDRRVPSHRRGALDRSAEHRQDRVLGRRQGLPEGASHRPTTPQAHRSQAPALTRGHGTNRAGAGSLGQLRSPLRSHAELGAAADAPQRINEIIDAVNILAHSPLIGRKVKGGSRELVIGRSSRGYVALYRFLPDIDTVFVLALRSQHESHYKRGT